MEEYFEVFVQHACCVINNTSGILLANKDATSEKKAVLQSKKKNFYSIIRVIDILCFLFSFGNFLFLS